MLIQELTEHGKLRFAKTGVPKQLRRHLDKPESTLEWNRIDENHRVLENPVPLSLDRPLALVVTDTIIDLNGTYDVTPRKIVDVEPALAGCFAFFASHCYRGLDENASATMRSPRPILYIFAEVQDCVCPWLPYRQRPRVIPMRQSASSRFHSVLAA